MYYGSVGQNLRSFNVSAAQLVAAPVQTTATSFGYPGTTPSVSAYNSTNGIVWATENTTPAVLHAYDANNLSTEFYNSAQAANSRDQFGAGNKFIAPTIANGKVYVGTQNSVGIFGFVRQQTPVLADGDYTLTNGASNLVLDDPARSTATGTSMYQWTRNGGANQEWFFSFNGQGYYTIQNVSSGLFLTDANGTATPGLSLQQGTPLNNTTQLWSLTRSGTNYILRNAATGLVIDDSGFNPNPGQSIILWTANGGSNQSWKIQ